MNPLGSFFEILRISSIFLQKLNEKKVGALIDDFFYFHLTSGKNLKFFWVNGFIIGKFLRF